MKQYVIIGNGVAAAGCIEGIRSIDKDSSITVISEENYPVYCRPLISYYLENKTDLTKMNYRSDDFYDLTGCRVLYGRKAVKIDTASHNVILDDGSAIPYSSVCVATGSSPFIPPFEGLDSVSDKFTFMTLDDTLALEAAISKDSKVLIVGAGLIGLKCAEGLHERVARITVCDLADRVLSSILDAECAAIMQKHVEANGIEFLLGDTVECFAENAHNAANIKESRYIARMKSGKSVEFDVLVLAVGVRANTSLVKDIGGEVGRGITVNDRMETSVPDVYAAGDCTEGTDISCGQKKVLALLPNAYMQGHTAGINMAGGNAVFDKAIPMNSIGLFGLHAMTAGSYFGDEDGCECYEEKTEGKLKRLFVKDGFLKGFILIGETERAGIYTSLIRERIPLDTINFELLKKVPTYAAFSAQRRRKIFGGVV